MSQSNEDIDEQMASWDEGGEDKNDADFEDPAIVAAVIAADKEAAAADKEEFAADKAAVEKGKETEVIDVDADEGKKRTAIAKRSDMWQHFIEIKDEDGVVVKGRCKYCKNAIAAHAVNNGTSAMRRHFNTCKRNPFRAHQGVLQVKDGSNVGTWKFDPEMLRTAFSEMIIEDELPFAHGEKSGLKKFMALACPRFTLPSRRTCTRDTVKIYFEQKAKLKMFLQENCQRVSLTTDGWTSQQQDSYMTVTAHFIDNNWCLHKKIISFFKVKGKKGDDIGKHLQKVLHDWGLDKVMTVTVDNASANDSGVSYLRKQMNSLKTSIAQGKYLHMRCAAHIVNLIVQECLKEVLESIKRVRAAVRFVKNGTSRLVKFKECAILEKVDTKAFLSLDVCTRWNSTYDMLKAACAYEKVFARYADEDPYFTIELISDKGPGVPDEQDWENARKMAEFLGHFAEITKRVSASLSATSHTYFHEIGEVNILVNNWLNSSDPIQATMGKRMKDKFDKYWGQWHDIVENESEKAKGKEKDKENINLLIFVAVVLDPRYKLSQYTEFAIHQIYGQSTGEKVWAAVNKGLHGLFEEYRATFAPSDGTPQSTESESPQSKQVGGSDRMMKSMYAKRMKLNSGSSSSYNRGSRTELEKYLAEECEDDIKNFDILAWWKGQSSRFPILSRLARDVLAIPISTVASESAFSTCGRIMDDFRTSLTPFMVEALVCTQDWLKRATPTNIAENTEELTYLEEGNSISNVVFLIYMFVSKIFTTLYFFPL